MAMHLNRYLALSIVVLLSLALWRPALAHNGKTAYAIPLKDIVLDGKLDDWPVEMAQYPVEWLFPYWNPAPPDGPEDFTAGFRVGYDLQNQVFYVAVVVRDEDLVVNPEAPKIYNQDVVGLLVDADHSGGDNALEPKEAQFYLMAPEPDLVGDEIDGNPGLYGGQTSNSGIEAAFLRSGQTTVYEWAIPLLASFPDKRLQIEPGKTIGFDMAIGDVDGEAQFIYLDDLGC